MFVNELKCIGRLKIKIASNNEQVAKNFTDYTMTDQLSKTNNTENNISGPAEDGDINEIGKFETDKEHKCKNCTFRSHKKKSLKTHRIQVHGIKCNLCTQISYRQARHDEHMKLTHPQEIICDKCEYKSYSKQAAQKHFRRYHDESYNWHNCDLCVYKDMFKRDIRFLMTKYTEECLSCDLCDKDYKSLTNLNQHKKTDHDKVRFSCEYCGHETTRPIYLREHIKAKHQ